MLYKIYSFSGWHPTWIQAITKKNPHTEGSGCGASPQVSKPRCNLNSYDTDIIDYQDLEAADTATDN